MPTNVYHAWPRDPRQAFSDHLADLDEARLALIAHLATDDVEQAFVWSQHEEAPWHMHWQMHPTRVLALQPGPYPLIGEAHSPTTRSTSVGDVLETTPEGNRFLVAGVGCVAFPARRSTAVCSPLHTNEQRRIGPWIWDVALAWRLVGQRAPDASPRPDGRDPLRVLARELLARLTRLDLRLALTDAVNPHIP